MQLNQTRSNIFKFSQAHLNGDFKKTGTRQCLFLILDGIKTRSRKKAAQLAPFTITEKRVRGKEPKHRIRIRNSNQVGKTGIKPAVSQDLSNGPPWCLMTLSFVLQRLWEAITCCNMAGTLRQSTAGRVLLHKDVPFESMDNYFSSGPWAGCLNFGPERGREERLLSSLTVTMPLGFCTMIRKPLKGGFHGLSQEMNRECSWNYQGCDTRGLPTVGSSKTNGLRKQDTFHRHALGIIV